MIADAVSSRSSKEDNNLIIFLETERMRAEERERVRVAEERVRQEERADERRRDEHRFQMQQQFQMQKMMLMMNPSRVPAPGPLLTPPIDSNQREFISFSSCAIRWARLFRKRVVETNFRCLKTLFAIFSFLEQFRNDVDFRNYFEKCSNIRFVS